MYWPPRVIVTNMSAEGDLKVVESDSSETLIGPSNSAIFNLIQSTGQLQLVCDGVPNINIENKRPPKSFTTDPIQVEESDTTVTVLQPTEDADFVLGPSDQLVVGFVQ